jgi:hypothetical protein
METIDKEKERNIPPIILQNIEKVVETIDKEEPITPSKKELDTY